MGKLDGRVALITGGARGQGPNETANLGIRVNAVCPTAVDSPMMDNEWAFSLFGGPGGTREDQLAGTRNLNAQPVPLIALQDVSNMALSWPQMIPDTSRASLTSWMPGHTTSSRD